MAVRNRRSVRSFPSTAITSCIPGLTSSRSTLRVPVAPARPFLARGHLVQRKMTCSMLASLKSSRAANCSLSFSIGHLRPPVVRNFSRPFHRQCIVSEVVTRHFDKLHQGLGALPECDDHFFQPWRSFRNGITLGLRCKGSRPRRAGSADLDLR